MIEEAKKILKKYYGYDTFRKGQERVINNILDGNDTFAIMPTGAGKSICYQVPAMLLDGITIVISPLISLMKDQVDTLKDAGVPAGFINSTLTFNQVEDTIHRALLGNIKLLYIAPERLESESFCTLLNTLNISLIAVDEAHCVSQWGHDFRPSYRLISQLIKNLDNRPIISAFTATATDEVKEDVIKLLGLKNETVYFTGFDRSNLTFTVIRGENKKNFVLNYLEENKNTSGIIYCATRKEVDNLYELLSEKQYSVSKYHAGLSDNDRKKNQEDFLFDNVNIMVATNAFGMGIDKSNVRYVIHYNLPKNMEAYYQEAGRAGRDSEASECILLFSPQDVMLQKYLIEQSVSSPERRSNEYKKLQLMVDYCHTPKCLRKYILEYFGESDVPETCGNCSTCNDDSDITDITIDAQKIFSCIYRMKERFGTSLITDVLKGSKNKKVLDMGFNTLSTYGIMEEYSAKDIKDLINILIAEEYLRLSGGEYPIVKLLQKAGAVLKGQEKVYLKVRKKAKKLESDNSLFEVLRSLRKDISEREKVPPYIVFSDATLKEMCKYYPVNKNMMMDIKGVGESKFEKYGEMFMSAIKAYAEENGIVLTKQEIAVDKDNTNKDIKEQSHVITLNMYKEGKTLEEIAKERDLKLITLQDHIIKCAAEGLDVNIDDFIQKEYEQEVLEAIKKIGADKLKPIKENVSHNVSYFTIKAVLCKYSQRL